MSISVSSAPVSAGMAADNRMIQRRDSMAADERAKNVSKLPYDENVGKLNKFYRQGTNESETLQARPDTVV